jgi:shikimate kinase/3-dehydroquinate synthase
LDAAYGLTVIGANGVEYPVVIAPGALADELPQFVRQRGFNRVALISNDTVAPLYAQQLIERLPGAFLLTVPDGEAYKTLDTVHGLYDALLEHGADRSTLVVALGGGVVGDMAGFSAASFMRGLPLIQAPTSLLAMVDASIGGKVGVDLPQGKNLVGAFKDPLGVFADTFVLETLPDVEFRCGLAEVVKAALIDDPALLEYLEQNGPQPIQRVIEDAAAVKIAIVEEDRLEQGIRAYLNLGHTFGHALEQVSGYAWRHGEAVSLGLVAATRLSELRRLCEHGLAARVEQLLAAFGLPVRYRGYDPAALWEAMARDKKWQEGASRFVLLRSPGKPVIEDGVPADQVLTVLNSLREDA